MDEDRERLILSLKREELKRALEAFGLAVADRRSAVQMRIALGSCRTASVESLMRLMGPTRASTTSKPSRSRVPKAEPVDHLRGPFVAIDFETADSGRDSACALAAVRVEGDRVVDRCTRLIRPPRQTFQFTYIHGIRWMDVAREPTFGPVWSEVRSLLKGATFLAAHNASFDKSVLRACCSRAGIEAPSLPFECTVRWARKAWGLYPTNLPAVCRHLDLPLRHHDAASDAEACARIMIAARCVGLSSS